MNITASHIWGETLKLVIERGVEVSPQHNGGTREIMDHTSRVSMRYPVTAVAGRDASMKLMCAEALWILQGSCLLEDIQPWCRRMGEWSNDGRTLDGAYGPKVAQQLRYCYDVLANDRHARQAVIGIWRENPRPSKDIPCTLSLQFLIRENQLHCMASMRSSDIWLGWPYDVFTFSMISTYLGLMLVNEAGFDFLNLGILSIRAGSQHLYIDNMAAAQGLNLGVLGISPNELSHYESPSDLLVCLRNVRDGHNVGLPPMFKDMA